MAYFDAVNFPLPPSTSYDELVAPGISLYEESSLEGRHTIVFRIVCDQLLILSSQRPK
jgi:hypothetical protein